MMGHKICFYEEILIIIPKLSLLLLLIWSPAHEQSMNTSKSKESKRTQFDQSAQTSRSDGMFTETRSILCEAI